MERDILKFFKDRDGVLVAKGDLDFLYKSEVIDLAIAYGIDECIEDELKLDRYYRYDSIPFVERGDSILDILRQVFYIEVKNFIGDKSYCKYRQDLVYIAQLYNVNTKLLNAIDIHTDLFIHDSIVSYYTDYPINTVVDTLLSEHTKVGDVIYLDVTEEKIKHIAELCFSDMKSNLESIEYRDIPYVLSNYKSKLDEELVTILGSDKCTKIEDIDVYIKNTTSRILYMNSRFKPKYMKPEGVEYFRGAVEIIVRDSINR